jgi:hypothetical protein
LSDARLFPVVNTSLSGYALLNALQTAADDFDVKQSSKMNTCSAREDTMFAPAQLLSNWCEQRPGNQSDLDLVLWGKLVESATQGETFF